MNLNVGGMFVVGQGGCFYMDAILSQSRSEAERARFERVSHHDYEDCGASFQSILILKAKACASERSKSRTADHRIGETTGCS